jgi:hypothetical protein
MLKNKYVYITVNDIKAKCIYSWFSEKMEKLYVLTITMIIMYLVINYKK